MAFSFISDALRQQTSEEEKTKGMQKVFAEEAASNLLRYMAQVNVKRGTERRGKQAKSASWGAEAKQETGLKRTRLEAEKETAAMSEQMGWVTAGAAAVGSITAYVAKEYEKSAQEEAEADALKEAQAAEEAPMLADFRKPGEEYSPSMLRDPGAVREGQEFNSEDLPDAYLQIMPGVDKGYRDTGLTATEFKAERDAYRAKKAAESLILDEKQAAAADSSREFTKEQSLLESPRGGRYRNPTAEQLYGPGWRKKVRDTMTEEDRKRLDSNWLEYLDMPEKWQAE